METEKRYSGWLTNAGSNGMATRIIAHCTAGGIHVTKAEADKCERLALALMMAL